MRRRREGSTCPTDGAAPWWRWPESRCWPSSVCGSSNDVTASPTTAGSSTTLEGTTWVLAKKTELGAELGDVVASATFTNGTVSGTSGCNTYNGPYKVDGDKLTIGPNLVSTQMACGPAETAVEKVFLERLPKVAVVQHRRLDPHAGRLQWRGAPRVRRLRRRRRHRRQLERPQLLHRDRHLLGRVRLDRDGRVQGRPDHRKYRLQQLHGAVHDRRRLDHHRTAGLDQEGLQLGRAEQAGGQLPGRRSRWPRPSPSPGTGSTCSGRVAPSPPRWRRPDLPRRSVVLCRSPTARARPSPAGPFRPFRSADPPL